MSELIPKPEEIRQHLDFLFKDMGEYSDGYFEISWTPSGGVGSDNNYYSRNARRFLQTEIAQAVDEIVKINSIEGQNVCVRSCLLDPNLFPADAASDEHLYAAPCAWVDIDEDVGDASAIRSMFKECAPALIIVTGEKPSLRTHLWFKYLEPETSEEAIREANVGLVDHFKGDKACVNPSRLMRIGGTVGWPKKVGRIVEMIQIKTVSGSKLVTPETLFSVYPISPQHVNNVINIEEYKTIQTGILSEKIIDGRENYMHRLITACIFTYVENNGAWPTEQEIFDEAWPTYERKVSAVGGRTLEQDKRGPRAMAQKIRSKLRTFKTGRFPGFPDEESIVNAKAKKDEQKAKAEEAKKTEEKQEEREKVFGFNINDWVASKRFTGKAKDIEWLVDGIFPLGVPALLAAMGGLGKSFTALDLCIQLTSETNHIVPKRVLGGHVVSRGKAVFITGEDNSDSIHRRINAVVDEHELTMTRDNLMVVPMPDIGGPQLLIRDSSKGIETTEFFNVLLEQLMQVQDLKLVVVDPLQAFVGADITSKPEAAQFMWSAFANISAKTGATFLCMHHMRKEGLKDIKTASDAREAVRGTTGIIDGPRVAYALWQANEDTGHMIAAHISAEYDPKDFVQGAVVKANDKHNSDLASYHRQESGLLQDIGPISTQSSYNTMSFEQCRQALAEIRTAWNSGQPYGRAAQSSRPIIAWLVKTFSISKSEAKSQLDNWLNPPGNGQPMLEERSIKSANRNTKLGLYAK